MAIRPSLRLALWLLLFHIIVAAVVYVTLMPLASMLAMHALIMLSMFYYLARDVLLLFSNSWRGISFDQDCVSVSTKNGPGFSGKIAYKTTVSPYLAVLSVKVEGHRLPVFRVIFPDALDDGAFRGLCVHLRFSQVLP